MGLARQGEREKRILVVEDDPHVAEGLTLNLKLAGYQVDLASTGPAGLSRYREGRPDLIVLDIMLPGMDGLAVLQNIRLEDERTPILILSAKGDVDDKIRGLALGVDDYLVKPFHLKEFLLRVERLLARSSWRPGSAEAGSDSGDTYVFGPNRVHLSSFTAYCRMGTVSLSEQEVKLLKLFFTNRGKPLSRKEILEIGWGYIANTETRTVDNFIVRFRKYFEEDPKNPVYFKSLRAVGYVFDHD